MMFFAIEGIDGSGGTTQAKMLSDMLDDMYIDHLNLSFPSPFLKDHIKKSTTVGSREHARLYIREMSVSWANVIKPALDRGLVVLADRYVMSTFAYQGDSAGTSWLINESSCLGYPDMNFVLDLDVDTCIKRINVRSKTDGVEISHYETKNNLVKVKHAYDKLAVMDMCGPSRIINAYGSEADTFKEIISVVMKMLT